MIDGHQSQRARQIAIARGSSRALTRIGAPPADNRGVLLVLATALGACGLSWNSESALHGEITEGIGCYFGVIRGYGKLSESVRSHFGP